MSSLGAHAYVGTLHYKELDPPIAPGISAQGIADVIDTNPDAQAKVITNLGGLHQLPVGFKMLGPGGEILMQVVN